MEKERGNLDDVLPPERFDGTKFAHWTFVEFAFWIVVGLLWLAFEGGVVGLIITVAVALFVGIAWRDIARRSQNPIEEPPPSNH